MVSVTGLPAEFSVDSLRRLLVAQGVPAGAPIEMMVQQARAPRHKLAITLLSALAVQGHPLTEAERAELAAHRERIERYAQAWAQVRAVAPDARVVKGHNIAALYPAGVIRAAASPTFHSGAAANPPEAMKKSPATLTNPCTTRDQARCGVFMVFRTQQDHRTLASGE